MAQITFPLLSTINAAVSLAYNTKFFSTASVYEQFTFIAESEGAESHYPRLDLIPGLREWIGDRVVHELSVTDFVIKNRLFEGTIAVARTDIEDDRYGILAPAAQQLGLNASQMPDLLVRDLFLNGDSTKTYDGQNFFDASHPNPTSSGGGGTVSNFAAGNATPWYLIDASQVLQPFIFQKRRPFQVVPKFSMDDPQVFFNKEFTWGVDGRCNAGYGLWQLAYKGKVALSVDNLTAARNAMTSIRRPNGTPMGIKPTLLVVPPSLYPDARALAENQFIPIDANTGAATLAPNPLRGLFKAVENPFLG